MSRTATFITVLALSLCAPTAHADGYDKASIIKIAKELGAKKEMPKDKLAELVVDLKATMNGEWFKKKVAKAPVSAVFVFRAGEGGLLVKFMKGDGLISFKGGREAAEIYLKSWSAGAQVGGSAQWGVGLVMGLKDEAHFGGDYTGGVKAATAGDSTATDGQILKLRDDDEGAKAHKILMISAGRGLSAGVGGERVTITPSW